MSETLTQQGAVRPPGGGDGVGRPPGMAEIQRLYRMIFGHPVTQIVTTAVRLGIPDALGDGAISARALAEVVEADEAALRRLLAALAELELVTNTAGDSYRLTELGRYLRSDQPGSVHVPALLAGHPVMWRAWGSLEQTVRYGEPGFETELGRPFFDHLADDSRLAELFNEVLAVRTQAIVQQIVHGFDFSSCGRIIDVGGGDGTLLAAILGANPSTTGLLFDSAPTVGQAKARLEDAGVADRCQVEAGDFFVAVPEGGDTYLLKNVLHDWSDAQSTAILRNCRRAMSTSSRLLVMTLLRDEDAAGDVGAAISDIEMMLLTRGRERTLAEYGDLLGSAGFRTGQSHLVAHPPAYYVVEAHPE